MSKRKRTWVDAKDIRVGECVTVAGTVLVVAEHEVTEHGVNISCIPTSPHGWSLHVMSLHPNEQIKVPRHFLPMFPNSRAEIMGMTETDPKVIANGLTYMDRKHLRRAGRNQRVPYTGARSLSRMGLYDGCALTALGWQVLEEIGDPGKP